MMRWGLRMNRASFPGDWFVSVICEFCSVQGSDSVALVSNVIITRTHRECGANIRQGSQQFLRCLQSPSRILSEVTLFAKSTFGKPISSHSLSIWWRYRKPQLNYLLSEDMQDGGCRHSGFQSYAFRHFNTDYLQNFMKYFNPFLRFCKKTFKIAPASSWILSVP